MNVIIQIFAARWLGAGLALEGFLSLAAGLYALVLLTLPARVLSYPTVDIAADYGAYIILPLVSKSLLTGCGVILNILSDKDDYFCSRLFRICGAAIGTVIWFGLSLQLAVNAQLGGFFIFCSLSYIASIRIMCMAWANIPEPGLMQAYSRLEP